MFLGSRSPCEFTWGVLRPGAAVASDADGYRAQATALYAETFLAGAGLPVAHRPLRSADKASMDRCGTPGGLAGSPYGCDGLAYADVIFLRAGFIGRLARGDEFAVETLLHEQLHTDRDYARIDEGVVDALAADLTPAFMHRIGAHAWGPVELHYDALVQVVRQASARATGGSWRARAARLWRRALWPMTSAERAQLIEGAFS